MPHKYPILLTALCLFWGILCTDARADSAQPKLWFDVGEELVYSIHWGVIRVAETRVTTEWIEEDGRKLIAIRYRTRSNSFLNKIYRVDDVIEAVIDPGPFLPVRFTKTLSEGKYRTDEVTVFDHAAGKAYWKNRYRNSEKEFDIESDTRDLVTFMYYMRQHEFETGEKVTYRVMADEKIYDVFLDVGSVDTLKTDKFGKVKSVRITPEAAFEGLFVRKGKIIVWVSRDERRVATRVQATVPVADIHINLSEVLGPGNDRWVGGNGTPAKTEAAAAVKQEAERDDQS
ncbi:MAG: DUF3108 domain-containing protein [Kiritimatiellae bacterium]|nr:DUF3108 domain-containing protein [Kiritimatiellia bacterium]